MRSKKVDDLRSLIAINDSNTAGAYVVKRKKSFYVNKLPIHTVIICDECAQLLILNNDCFSKFYTTLPISIKLINFIIDDIYCRSSTNQPSITG